MAATFVLSGTVTDGTSGGILPNIAVTIATGSSAGKATQTDGNGHYQLTGLAGSMDVSFTNGAYQPQTRTVTINGDVVLDVVLARLPPPPPPPPGPAACDGSLWQHVYDPTRLKIVSACATITGTVITQPDRSGTDDGDVTFHVVPDPGYAGMLQPSNNGYFHIEVICQGPILPDQPAAAKACGSFHGSVFLPSLHQHVSITGSYVLDTNHGNWAEIHPVTAISVIP